MQTADMTRNIRIYPWHMFFRNLLFWQATWFLYFQQELSAADAILLYAIFDITVTVLEVPSGYMSDRVGRRFTLIASSLCVIAGASLLTHGGAFTIFAAGQILLGVGRALESGTDTAMLFQSLKSSGRHGEMEAQSIKAWRASFAALAISAITGGMLASWSSAMPFALSAIAAVAALVCAIRYTEPSDQSKPGTTSEFQRLVSLTHSFRQPVLLWLFALSIAMYVIGHVPFVFGQPFIAEALKDTPLAGEAPLISGLVSAAMMFVSLIVSLFATGLRRRMGLATLLLLAFGLQITLTAVLAMTGAAIAIAVLLIRMVPDALSTAFISARLQPLLDDQSRATFLSIESFIARMLFALTLWLAALATSNVTPMPLEDVQSVLTAYALCGAALFSLFAFTARRARV